MPLPVLALASVAVKNPKILVGAAAAIPISIVLVFSMIAGVISGSTSSNGGAVTQLLDDYCKDAANSATGGYAGQAYEGSVGGDKLMVFLKQRGLTYNQAHVVWSLGMRESGAQNYTSSTPGFNGGYGVWQIEKPHLGTAQMLGTKLDGHEWTMDEIGADMAKNFEVMWWMTNKGKNWIAWGLAANQPANSIKFDWRIYEKIPGWMANHNWGHDAENVYRKWYNQFAAAVKKNGINFAGAPMAVTPVTPSASPSPTSSAPPFQTNPTKPPKPGSTPIPSTIAKPKPVVRPIPDVVNDPFNLFPGSGSNSSASGGAAQAPVPPGGDIYTVEGHVALEGNDPRLETFEVGGHNWTVSQEWVPTFRAFLMDWQSTPLLGAGRFSLDTGISGSFVHRRATMSPKWSDHAGYAVDIRYDILLPDEQIHMTPDERQAVRVLLQRYPALGWGGEYGAGAWDEMHIYVRRNAIPGDSVGVAQSTYIISDETLDPLTVKDGPLPTALAQYPYVVDSAKGRTIKDAAKILIGNQKAQDAGLWIISLGAQEAQVGKPVQGPQVGTSASPSPSASPVLLKPEDVKGWIEDVMNKSGGKQVYWVQEFVPGPSQVIVNDALTEEARQYKNLTIVNIAYNVESGYVTDKGVLTKNGAEFLSNSFAASVADAQPEYTARADCAKYLFAGMNSDAVLDGPFQDRTDYVIDGAAEIVARANSYVGISNAPCGRCVAVCDHLAGIIHTGVNGASMYDSAKTHWYHTLDGTGQWGTGHPDDKSIPVGAVVFFTASENGHVATYVGGGWVISNWRGPNGPAVMKVPLKDMAAALGYLGWAEAVYPGPGH